MTSQTSLLNTAQLHRKMKAYITQEISTVLQHTRRTDRILIEDEDLEYLHQSSLVICKMNTVIDRFYTHQDNIVKWFHAIEQSLPRPAHQEERPMTFLGFEGVRINRSRIRCETLKPATVKKILDNAKGYAVRKVLPEKQKFTTGDVLSFYFHEYTRVNMYDFKVDCAKKLKKIHREILERLPLDPVPLDDMDYQEMFRAIDLWLDDNEFGIDVGMTHTCASSYLPSFPDAANPTKKLSLLDDFNDGVVDF